MRRLLLVATSVFLALGGAQSAFANECRDRIAALYNGGAMDERVRRPHRIEILQYDSQGTMTERHVGKVIDGTHYQLFSEVSKMGVLYVGTEIWYASGSPDGPWGNKQEMPAVRAEDLVRQLEEKAASVTEAECLGQMQDNGVAYDVYRWRVFTETLEEYGGGINGARHEAWVDPDSGELAILRDSEVVTPWKKTPDGSRTETRFTYDDSITITAPE